jgi:phosphatidylethanolamine/phosphatidyl-N-methylethanolamine N-methyltransferase
VLNVMLDEINQSSRKESSLVRRSLSRRFYDLHYARTYYQLGPLSSAIDRMHASVESRWIHSNPVRTCEFGFGSGEHLRYVRDRPTDCYVGVDLEVGKANEHLSGYRQEGWQIHVIQGDAADTALRSSSFDRVAATCLLHHVVDPFSVLLEMRRICSPGGEISFILPTDPGILNRCAKAMITYPLLRKSGIENPRLLYAIEHINHVGALLEITKTVFRHDQMSLRYRPVPLPTWNWNLWISVHVVRSDSANSRLQTGARTET